MEQQMQAPKRARRKYTAEFKQSAVDLVEKQGYSLAEASRRVGRVFRDARAESVSYSDPWLISFGLMPRAWDARPEAESMLHSSAWRLRPADFSSASPAFGNAAPHWLRPAAAACQRRGKCPIGHSALGNTLQYQTRPLP